MKGIWVAGLLLVAAASARAEVKTKAVIYKQGDAVLEGYLAWDAAATGKRPGVLIAHAWMGIGPHEEAVARRLAEAGYVAFCADIYGQGIRPKTPEEAGKQAGVYKSDRALTRARAAAGLAQLTANPAVDPKRVAVIGYCFGGMVTLELARSGADLAGAVVFHGDLSNPTPADDRNIKAKVLALQGGDDPFVPAKAVAAFEDEMRAAGVDWQLVQYGGAVHAYTDPAVGSDNSKGAAYNERADRRSWQAMRDFFAEIFK
ncbi:MAG TPA: dienelactone hydrolase family protein [Thermoanaerobaculaceae bacterium]|nr:dienelactone hydrolase family protein [Thermoanaerobaculaceae bacterium]